MGQDECKPNKPMHTKIICHLNTRECTIAAGIQKWQKLEKESAPRGEREKKMIYCFVRSYISTHKREFKAGKSDNFEE